jgi:hypothetical protein
VCYGAETAWHPTTHVRGAPSADSFTAAACLTLGYHVVLAPFVDRKHVFSFSPGSLTVYHTVYLQPSGTMRETGGPIASTAGPGVS